ncbi:hypothetical protein [Streptomyces uncialis]|uniref:Uncharacterized protein n=1 Tax=Streptomyces uncialis TaxID=1048205 RepID=A0A1Q4V2Z9_9ACTN|nr:hypothetical protein [Streptomyces uncialis]OKH92207.1 hypothetical protein AB852_25065 [Streptomyces uncialis]
MRIGRTLRTAGAWGHLLLVAVLALGVFMMHTVGHQESPSGTALDSTAHGAPPGADPPSTAGHGSPGAATLTGAAPMATDPATPWRTVAWQAAPDATTSDPATSGHVASGQADPGWPAPGPAASAQAGPGQAAPGPAAESASSHPDRAAAAVPAVSGEHDEAPSHDTGMAMDMASLCVAVLAAWLLAALLRAALSRRTEWLVRLRAGALRRSLPQPPPSGPDLIRLSILRI